MSSALAQTIERNNGAPTRSAIYDLRFTILTFAEHAIRLKRINLRRVTSAVAEYNTDTIMHIQNDNSRIAVAPFNRRKRDSFLAASGPRD